MYYKLKNTLAGIGVAAAMLAVSFAAGRPPMLSDARFEIHSPTVQSRFDTPVLPRKHSLRQSLSMPYFSFGPVLPRRES